MPPALAVRMVRTRARRFALRTRTHHVRSEHVAALLVEGHDVVEIELTLGQTYRFRYLFDGTTWCDEWASDGYVPNDYGTFDGLVVAKLPEDS